MVKFSKLCRQKKVKLREEFEVKSQAYDIISLVNDEYLKVNNALKKENEKLIREINEFKSKQLKSSKPFVDLTCDDDSDVEIIDENRKMPETIKIPDASKKLKASEIIEVEEDDEPKPEPEANKATLDEPFPLPSLQCSMLDSFNMKYSDDPWNIQEFEKFIVGQI